MKATNKMISEALLSTGGLVYPASQKLGMSASALYKRIRASKELQEAISNAQEITLDLAESKLIKNMKDGKESSIFFQKTRKIRLQSFFELRPDNF